MADFMNERRTITAQKVHAPLTSNNVKTHSCFATLTLDIITAILANRGYIFCIALTPSRLRFANVGFRIRRRLWCRRKRFFNSSKTQADSKVETDPRCEVQVPYVTCRSMDGICNDGCR